jgi:hypothetical protein
VKLLLLLKEVGGRFECLSSLATFLFQPPSFFLLVFDFLLELAQLR